MNTLRASVLLALLVMLLVAAGWPAQLPEPWNMALLPGLGVLILLACLPFRLPPLRVWLAALGWLVFMSFYAWNASHEWTPGLGLLPREHWLHWPASAYPTGTWAVVRLGVAICAAVAAGFALPRRQVSWLGGVLAVAAGVMALVVIAQRLEPSAPRIREFTGIFVNENHYAVFANLLLPIALFTACRARFRAVQVGFPSSPAGLFYLVGVLIAISMVMCRSRAGMAIMTFSIAMLFWVRWRTTANYPFATVPASTAFKIAGTLLIMVSLGFAVRAFRLEWRELEVIVREWAFRSGILKHALEAWRARPIWGIGPGAFPVVFPYYQSAEYARHTILHAHNEPVQFLVEYGWAGLAILLVLALMVFSARRKISIEEGEIPAYGDFERHAFGLAVVAFALHSLVDFPLRIPLLTLLTATWIGIWLGARPPRSKRKCPATQA